MLDRGWELLYYPVEQNSPEIVCLFLLKGVNPHETHTAFLSYLLAFAIISGHQEARDTTAVVRELLAFGVEPKVIPMDMWTELLETPRETITLNKTITKP